MSALHDRLAALHAAAFAPEARGWSAAEIAALAGRGLLIVAPEEAGFALFSHVADEAELLTLAVAPEHRRRGVARALLRDGMAALRRRGATRLLLEVAADNAAALALYEDAGFEEIGRRPRYYARRTGPRIDALTLASDLSP